tara:strand:+ start:275 stop:439 length:165 start_codon:yes stop_codon:yes gene_type:complete
MNLEEYKKLKSDNKDKEEYAKDIVVVKDNEEITIQLGALQNYLKMGYKPLLDDF